MSIDFTDIFCGAGGSSIGLVAAGLELKLAANHWDRAIETHSANFPHADHLIADVSNYDMRRLPRTQVLWASPECTWHSPAGGRKSEEQIRAQLDLFEDYVPNAAGVRSRATAFDVIRAAEVHRYKVIIVENVVEFATRWELFDWWIGGLRNLGYTVQLISVSSAHVGDDCNAPAPQWRDRLYVYYLDTFGLLWSTSPVRGELFELWPVGLGVEFGEQAADAVGGAAVPLGFVFPTAFNSVSGEGLFGAESVLQPRGVLRRRDELGAAQVEIALAWSLLRQPQASPEFEFSLVEVGLEPVDGVLVKFAAAQGVGQRAGNDRARLHDRAW
jgi:hypothetical protein